MALVNNDGTNPDINLYECFDYYQKIEVMTGDNQMYCNICKDNKDALYSTILYSAPKYLIINIDYGKDKKYQPSSVEFDDIIDITQFVEFDYKQKIKYKI